MDLKATLDYTKYTMTLCTAGFAYAGSLIGSTDTALPLLLARIGTLLALIAFLLALISGGFTISAITGALNDAPPAPADPPATGSAAAAPDTRPTPSRRKSIRLWFQIHFWTMVIGFLLAGSLYIARQLHQEPPPERCTMTTGETTISFDCKAEAG